LRSIASPDQPLTCGNAEIEQHKTDWTPREPWITPRTGDGRFLFGVLDADRQRTCLTHRRCQICGKGLGRTLVLLARQSDLPRRCTAEPPAHLVISTPPT